MLKVILNYIKFKRNKKMGLTEEEIKNIEHHVKTLRQEKGIITKKFDLMRFLQESENFKIISQDMDDDTTGMLIVNDRRNILFSSTNKLIVVNSNLQYEDDYLKRRRHIVAHEYAHYILHKTDRTPYYAHRDTSHKGEKCELEADLFARCLLMPKELIIQELKNCQELNDIEKIEHISNEFNVTVKKAKIRLMELEVITNVY